MKGKDLALRGLLLALALVLSWLESLLPLSFAVPGIKLGLPNAAVVFALYRLSWRDAALISLLRVLLISLLFGSWAALRLTRRAGGSVSVTVDGVEVASLPLDRGQSFVWEGEAGKNTLVVENGAAHMKFADCPDGLCIRQGEIRYTGESIVCLPHRLMAVITGGAESRDEGAVDAVAQ